ncbi:hypothetical protein FRC12_009319 [Ceratobasidium sp. 428]|nr:hypothetical protein FRC12_009319 [Ceratobasidium sp. 428]
MTVVSCTTGANYELPATIKSIQDGWRATFQNSLIISSMFVVIESILLLVFNDFDGGKFNPGSSRWTGLYILTYLGFFSSISATFCSLFLISEFGQLHGRAAQREPALEPLVDMVIQEDIGDLLRRYGLRRIARPMIWYWIFMLLVGFLSLFGQLISYVWITEARPVAIAVSCVAGFALFPLFSILPF